MAAQWIDGLGVTPNPAPSVAVCTGWDGTKAADDFPLVNQDLALGALAALAHRGLSIPADAVQRGFAAARWP